MPNLDRRMLLLAVRAALRGAGRVEPNPMVGCVIGTPDGRVLGIGHHERFGGPHAEVNALASCARLGHSPRGATAWVTLEPCNHHGKTPPCSRALIASGIKRVVIARVDPNPISTGGVAALREAGLEVTQTNACAEAHRLSDAFATTITQRRPWVIAKWAQTIDGRIATRTGESKWLSGEKSRARVHALRGRVDAIITGIGTALADDPRLTCRAPVRRRTPRRVLIDPHLRLPDSAALLQTIAEAPLTIATTLEAAHSSRAEALGKSGVDIIGFKADAQSRFRLCALLEILTAVHRATNVLVEAGPGLMGHLLAEDLIDELHVYTAPLLIGDPQALAPVNVGAVASLSSAPRFELLNVRRLHNDVVSVYRRTDVGRVTSTASRHSG